MKYTCSKCGQEHEGRPALGFNSPHPYNSLSQNDKNSIATLSDDFCTIVYDDQTDRFIRGVIHLQVKDDCETLDYGVWVSLSENSFNDYKENFHNESHAVTYFGYICNNLTGYNDTMSIKANVVTRGKTRPEIIPHDDQMENEFVKDYYGGIDKRTAEERIRQLLNQ
jgi:hypothetical protein